MDLIQYMNECLKRQNNVDLKKNIVIYGTGAIGKKVKELLENHGYHIDAILNKNKSFLNVTGMEVTDVKEYDFKKRSKVSVVIAIFNGKVNLKQTMYDLEQLGYTHIITYPMLMEAFQQELETTFYLCDNVTNKKYISEIGKCENIWADEKSIKLYESLIRFRFSKNIDFLEEPENISEQYFPSDIANVYPEDKIRFIDCGAYDGDTVRGLLNKNRVIDGLAAFEPDLDNYHKLCNTLKESENCIRERISLPCGVGDKSETLRFSGGGDTGSAVSEDGNMTIQCITIDQCIPDFRPNIIKMDIEGSEFGALLGAEKVIKKYKPTLMICLYHLPEDIFRIPLLVQQWDLNYNLYLRMYENNGWELVMYATI